MDDLNEAIRDFEKAMVSRGLLYTATLPFGDSSQISWRKVERNWSLFVSRSDGWHMLLKSGREARVEAAGMLIQLYEAVLKARSSVEERTRSAIVMVKYATGVVLQEANGDRAANAPPSAVSATGGDGDEEV